MTKVVIAENSYILRRTFLTRNIMDVIDSFMYPFLLR